MAIVKAFKIWFFNIKDCKHKVFIIANKNNYCWFINTMSLSSKIFWLAQNLYQYHFWIDYQQKKAKRAAHALSQFAKRSQIKKKALKIEKSLIMHCLQASLVNTNLSDSRININASSIYKLLIYTTHILPQLCQISKTLKSRPAYKDFYQAYISDIRLYLLELQAKNTQTKLIKLKPREDRKDIVSVLYHKIFWYIYELI